MSDIAVALSVLISALAFVSGVSAWKREFVGKRRIELAESVLASFYEAEDAVREIRNPFSSTSEGKSRKRASSESEEEAQLLDQAYVVVERYQRYEQLFAQLRSQKYRFMASFGPQSGEPFDELTRVINEIFAAARMLGNHYWPRQGRVAMTEDQFERHLQGMQRAEAIFWQTTEEEDLIKPRVRAAVSKIEDITEREAYARAPRSLWRRRKRSRA